MPDNRVTGPFIEYRCHSCSAVVQENADMPRDKLKERIIILNTNKQERICACCSDHST